MSMHKTKKVWTFCKTHIRMGRWFQNLDLSIGPWVVVVGMYRNVDAFHLDTPVLYSILWLILCASHCFPFENAGRQDFTHMIARPSINKDIKRSENNQRHTIPVSFQYSAPLPRVLSPSSLLTGLVLYRWTKYEWPKIKLLICRMQSYNHEC